MTDVLLDFVIVAIVARSCYWVLSRLAWSGYRALREHDNPLLRANASKISAARQAGSKVWCIALFVICASVRTGMYFELWSSWVVIPLLVGSLVVVRAWDYMRFKEIVHS
jgi:hypothetical protein